jgi:TRAP-type mannitol/chloroaromatic compound transport system permease large subunit
MLPSSSASAAPLPLRVLVLLQTTAQECTHNIDPIWLGILVAINLQTAFLSPPVAMAAFYIKGVSPPGVLLADIWRGMMPYIGLHVAVLLLVYFYPQLALWLPDLIIK